ncbi:MAG: LLM class flavin-dependent oxidoreductase, partial [Ginsengibacter sp.]
RINQFEDALFKGMMLLEKIIFSIKKIVKLTKMELGIYSFVEMDPQGTGNKGIEGHKRMQELMEEIVLAEQVGLDVFAIGEHHRADYLVSSPAVVLAAASQKTSIIKLSSAVTVLSSDDPVRVFQDFATVDLLSKGRAEIMAGRGSFIESFPLFGYDLKDYDELFTEKLELLLKINAAEKVSWQGKLRPSINNLGIYPRPFQNQIPIWVAVGGTPESLMRAGQLGLPMALAIIGGSPQRFKQLVQLYRESFKAADHTHPSTVGINSHVFIGDDSTKAADDFYPSYATTMTRIGRERGWGPMNRMQFDMMRQKEGSLIVGNPQEVIDKILYEYELFENDRFLAQMTVGPIDHKKLMRSIELFGTVVAPAVRKFTKSQLQNA